MNVLRKTADAVLGGALTCACWFGHTKSLKNYVRELRHFPHVAFPKRYNEKMFWRRVFDHNPAFTTHCDKLATKELFARLDPPLPSFRTLWVGERPEDIPEALIRDDVVFKHNAGCNRNWFVAREGKDRDALAAKCHRWMSETYGIQRSEWGYGTVTPKLFAEEVLETDPFNMAEFKVHLINGEVFYTIVVVGEKTGKGQSAIFSDNGTRLSVTTTTAQADPRLALPDDFALPDLYPLAMQLARQVARDLDYIRVDFICLNGTLYGSEVTPYPTAGLMTNSDPAVLARMGETWDMRRSWFLRTKQKGWREAYRRMLMRWIEREEEARPAPVPEGAPG